MNADESGQARMQAEEGEEVSTRETMRQKFDQWYSSPHGEAAMEIGMHYTGWAYEAFAAGYRQAALDLGREVPADSLAAPEVSYAAIREGDR